MDKPVSHFQSVCVFCASSEAVGEGYKKVARNLGHLIGEAGLELIYGGASIGLMGEVARGVHERRGRVVGVLPRFFLNKEITYEAADELIVTQDMRERKSIMDGRADAFIVLPGGVGTLEEAMEILSQIQLKQTTKPLVFINTDGFYDGLEDFFRHLVKLDFAKQKTFKLFGMEKNPEGALGYIRHHYAKAGEA